MFRNYWHDGRDATGNETVVRLLLGLYVAWKLAYLPTWRLQAYPRYYDFYDPLLVPLSFELLPVLQALGIALAAAFALHYQFRVASFGLGTVLSYIGLVSRTHTFLGNYQSLFFAALLVFLYGVYHDGQFTPPKVLWRMLVPGRSPNPPPVRSPSNLTDVSSPLKWFLAVTALTYAGGAVDKLRYTGLDWVLGDTLGAFIIYTHTDLDYHHPLADILLHHPTLLTLGAGAALALQLGFVIGVFLDVVFDWLVAGLICFHVLVAVLLGPVFFDQVVFLFLFIDWQHLSENAGSLKDGVAGLFNCLPTG